MQHTRLSGVTVLATGVATIVLLFLLLYAHASGQIAFLQAIGISVLVSLPIAGMGLCRPSNRRTAGRQLFSEAGS